MKYWKWIGGAVALLLLVACGPTAGGNTPPAAPAPQRPSSVTFWVYAYDAGKQEYIQNLGLTLSSLDVNMQPVSMKDKQTGQVTEGVQTKPSEHTPVYWQANLTDPGVATVELAGSAIMPKGAYLYCEVHTGPVDSPPTPHNKATMINSFQSDPSTPSGVLTVATVLLSCIYP